MTQRLAANAERFRGKGDFALAGGVVLILALMLIPLPTFILDLMLSFSISLSFLVLLTSMFMNKSFRIFYFSFHCYFGAFYFVLV